jgi:hypothetical protein
MTDSILCTVKQVEAICVFLQQTKVAFWFATTIENQWGDTPTSQIVWGVLVWNGLNRHTHKGFPNLGKNF